MGASLGTASFLMELLQKEFQPMRESLELSQRGGQVVSLAADNKELQVSIKSLNE